MADKSPPGPPMDLANMRDNGVRCLLATCRKCQVERVVNMDDHDGGLAVKSFGPRMVCQACGAKGADVMPNWAEKAINIPRPYPKPESLGGSAHELSESSDLR